MFVLLSQLQLNDTTTERVSHFQYPGYSTYYEAGNKVMLLQIYLSLWVHSKEYAENQEKRPAEVL